VLDGVLADADEAFFATRLVDALRVTHADILAAPVAGHLVRWPADGVP
jgi:hypothetical protein